MANVQEITEWRKEIDLLNYKFRQFGRAIADGSIYMMILGYEMMKLEKPKRLSDVYRRKRVKRKIDNMMKARR
jgi:hypothetical protein